MKGGRMNVYWRIKHEHERKEFEAYGTLLAQSTEPEYLVYQQ